MATPPAPSTRLSIPGSASSGPPPAPTGTDDAAALLLSVLRTVNRQALTTQALDDNAEAAIANFRAIAESLRTLADSAPGT